MTTTVYSRTRCVVNTDPQRRCYDGVNFSERVEFGPWEPYREYATPEVAELVMNGLRCERYEYKAEQNDH